MSYSRYLIDASSLAPEVCAQVADFISTHTSIYRADLSHPGVYSIFLCEEDIPILDNPVFLGCVITAITQSGI